MKNVLLTIIVLMICIIDLSAQTHYVIAFDCTKSMDHPNAFFDGDYSDKARDVSRVWEPAKKSVKDVFDKAIDDDEFTIILFQDHVLDVINQKKEYLSWGTINDKMEAAITHGGNTCILSAWECAEKYFDKSSNTLFYLITDGVEDHLGDKPNDDDEAKQHTELLCGKIKDFCSTHTNTFGFYTNLVRVLHDSNINAKAINTALDSSECFRIKIAGTFESLVVVDMDEEKKNYVQSIPVIFHPKDRDRIPVTINDLEIKSSDKYFTVSTNGKMSANRFEVEVKLNDSIPNDLVDGQYYSFPMVVSSSSSAKYMVDSQEIIVRVNFKRSSVVFLPTNECVGKSTYQKPFKLLEKVFPKIAAEKSPTIIRFDLDTLLCAERGNFGLFNEEAVRIGAQLKIALNRKNQKPIPPLTMSYNGTPCENMTATIKSLDKTHVIEIVFDKEAKSGIYYLQFDVVGGSPINLDRINADVSCNYSNDLTLTFEVKPNPWYVAALWILVLVVIILLLWIVIANWPTRKMVGQLMPYGQAPLILQGKVKGVFSSKDQKQRILSRLFNGPYVFSEPDGFWTSELVVKRGRKYDMIYILPSDDYEINGNVINYPFTVYRNDSFDIKNKRFGQTLTINYI